MDYLNFVMERFELKRSNWITNDMIKQTGGNSLLQKCNGIDFLLKKYFPNMETNPRPISVQKDLESQFKLKLKEILEEKTDDDRVIEDTNIGIFLTKYSVDLLPGIRNQIVKKVENNT